MTQIWKIFQWEYMNRVKSKLFLITTFLLPFFMGGMMYLPSMLMDLEPEETSVKKDPAKKAKDWGRASNDPRNK